MQAPSPAVMPGWSAWGNLAARVFACACFFPYPAVAIGGSNGLQASQALSVASVPLLCGLEPSRSFRALLLLLTPIYLSALLNSMLDTVPATELLPKESAALTLALLVLWPTDWVMKREYFRAVLTAACAAIVVHALIGLYQVYSFRNDEFPLLFLYRNPSFKSMELWAPIYARYMKRPCGLFPEPSAMGASLGPWLVVLAGLFLEPERARTVGWRCGKLASLALACGFTLIALSRSGSTFAIMGAMFVLCLGRVPSWYRSFGLRELMTAAVIFVAVVSVAGYAAFRLSQGLEDRMESSWGLRGLSLKAGLTSNTDPVSLTLGVGPGQSTPIIRRELAGVPLPPDQDELAIFSLTVCYYMETGLVGALAMLTVLIIAIRAIARSSAVLLGFCALGTWLMGVAATTSYMPLSAIWLFLGAMLWWDRLFPPSTQPARASNDED